MATSTQNAPFASGPSSSSLWNAHRSWKQTAKSPLVTYGRQNRPLSLTANQFVRKDTFDFPSDDDRHDQEQAASHEVIEVADDRGSDFDSSMLSGAEGDDERSNEAQPSLEGQSPTKLQILKAASASGHARPQKSQHSAKMPGIMLATKRRPDSEVTKTKSGSSAKQSKRARKLPEIGELVCVTQRPDDEVFANPVSAIPEIEDQDPVADVTQPETFVEPSAGRKGNAMPTKTPLEKLRKRLRSTSLSYKTSSWLKRRRAALNKSKLWNNTSKPTIGDGFDALELEFAREMKVPKPQLRRKGRRVRSTIAPLQLMGGPLPDVVFDCPPDELGLDHGTHYSGGGQAVRGSNATQSLKRRVSFSNSDELIHAKLAAFKAPARIDSDEEDEEADEEATEANDEDAIVEGFEVTTDRDVDNESADELSMHSTPPRPIRRSSFVQSKHFSASLADCREAVEEEEEEEEDDEPGSGAVHHDYGRTANRGQAKSQMNGVEDAILHEVEGTNAVPITREFEMQDGSSTSAPLPTSSSLRVPRLRSILKHSDQSMPTSTVTPAGDTKLNTQRNSRRATNNLVEITEDEGEYFSAAAGSFDADSEPRIIRRQKSNSRYFEPPPLDSDIEIPDSLIAVPETSSVAAKAPFSDESQLAVLREMSANVKPRTAPTKDLKSLTRAVSKEHGTLSQSVRRQGSSRMGFVSPVKPARRKIEQC